jgi:hypothetical protein
MPLAAWHVQADVETLGSMVSAEPLASNADYGRLPLFRRSRYKARVGTRCYLSTRSFYPRDFVPARWSLAGTGDSGRLGLTSFHSGHIFPAECSLAQTGDSGRLALVAFHLVAQRPACLCGKGHFP